MRGLYKILHTICITVMCLFEFSLLQGMQSQDAHIVTKLKLVLTAGRYVYKEHQAIHVDALNRARTMLELFNISEEQKIAHQLDLYCVLLLKVQATYTQYCLHPEQDVINALEESRRSCLMWALAIPSKHISRKPWTVFREVFRAQQKKAQEHFKQADQACEQYALGKDISVSLSVESAVKAWCIELPKI